MDFGVKQDEYCSDIQRMWYVLRDGEMRAPASLRRAFDAIAKTIYEGSKALKPGAMGLQARAWRPGAPVSGVFVNGDTIVVAAVNTGGREMTGTVRLEHAPAGLTVLRSESFEWKRAGDVTQRRPDEIIPGPRAVELTRKRSSVDLRYSLPADGWACWMLSGKPATPAGERRSAGFTASGLEKIRTEVRAAVADGKIAG
ncbi:MAG: M24 family metallopeptidase, partial [bacterium]